MPRTDRESVADGGQRSIESVLKDNLDTDQYAAATDTAREVLTLACAGSGKSRTLAYRIARLVSEGGDPKGIVAFTFTEKAADTMKRRIAEALASAGLETAKIGAMFVGTIHSYCKYVLSEMDARYRQFEVLDENRLVLYLISRYYQLGLQEVQSDRDAKFFETVRKIADAWTTVNDEMIDLAEVERYDPVLGAVLKQLWGRLDQDNFIDFSLMIRLVVEALKRGDEGATKIAAGIGHLMVDEYQDINPAQEALIREIHKHDNTLFVVGDDDQAIYAWRGADVNMILTFERRYPKCARHTLPKNYRSIPAIVRAADAFARAELGATRIAKNPLADEPEGARDFRALWFGTRQDEAEAVADFITQLRGAEYREPNRPPRGLDWADFAILMRSTRQPEQEGAPRHASFTRALEARGIPFTLEAGGSIFDRAQVAVLRETLELLRDGQPTREAARQHFDGRVVPSFPDADFDRFVGVLADWGRKIHGPADAEGARRRVYPQELVHDLLNAFGIQRLIERGLAGGDLDEGMIADLGVFSRIFQDVESVYVSIDSRARFAEILNFLQQVAEYGYDTSEETGVARPNAIAVSTVHKAKGLEFPVVFVVDVEAGRFPVKKRDYEGWLPQEVLQEAFRRGAYLNSRREEARLFYTALTRAGRCLYVSGASVLPGGVRERKRSDFLRRLRDDALSESTRGLPAFERLTPARGFDESVLPTAFSDIRYYLLCPRDYWFRKWLGFSPPIPEMFGFGQTVHAAVGKLHEKFGNGEPSGDEAEEVARATFHLKHVPKSSEPEERPGPYERARDKATDVVRRYAEDFADDFRHTRQLEARFEVSASRSVITGSIDLLLDLDARGKVIDASVIDFKAIEKGPDGEPPENYDWTELSLQVQLYALAAVEVLEKNARTGKVHFLRDSTRVEVPITPEAIRAAVGNVEWAVDRILAGDFPMRPHPAKCARCDWAKLCPKVPQDFAADGEPPAIHVPVPPGQLMIRAFREYARERPAETAGRARRARPRRRRR